jgi:hypothetical protein
MTFDKLCQQIMEQGTTLTVPTIPKMNLSSPGGQQTINTPSTTTNTTDPSKTNQPNTPQANQQDGMNKQTNAYVQNSYKKIKDLEQMVNDLGDQVRKSQGLPPAAKKPSIMSNVVNPQMVG